MINSIEAQDQIHSDIKLVRWVSMSGKNGTRLRVVAHLMGTKPVPGPTPQSDKARHQVSILPSRPFIPFLPIPVRPPLSTTLNLENNTLLWWVQELNQPL